ncbi:MAG: glycosyl transferase family 1 [Bdellovibrionales bacterium CG12_big_fil_rev_8_21_14_0_65_38_15]|nr:MAG: glycosyl transferase family 1 [Bdellovibrionales bacterium CG22_combo_CG10-13_8_21_14_all_38_13]PIQ57183.1 MAG: glycosyl transferase family 1 [Bdellovibrionales bacterium CG12_big_fil_rev_8_21_14_0_65_38_15]PIR31377.1 MAG: glycosyl transferase family 1 [Bdellovibrionales bacterium CG11_big_fil_rev_8_21_14_0_20_38_13]
MKKLKVLTIGHSYVVASNRGIAEAIHFDPSIEMTIAAPLFMNGSLRPLALEKSSSTDGPNVVGLPAYFTRYNHFFFYRNLASIIKPGAFDLIHIWEEPYVLAGFQIARAAKIANIPYFFRSAQSLNKKYPFPFSFFEKFVLRNARGWNAGASLVYQNLLARGYPQKNSVIINLGVKGDLFYPARDTIEKDIIKEELNLKGPVLCFIGRLVYDKGLDVLMSALEDVKSHWNLIALGSGPYKEKIEKWAHENNFQDRVKVMLVKHDEVPRILRGCDILVAPSQTMPNWKEQFGRMLAEAFASKVTVIGSDSGEIPFVIAENGLVVGEKDIKGWTTNIELLLTNEQLRNQLAEKGRAKFLEELEVSAIAKKYIQFYHHLTSDK